MTNQARAAAVALLLPLALLAGAYGSELIGLKPCEMCWWQRWAHMAAVPFAFPAVLLQLRGHLSGSTSILIRMLTVTAAVAILTSGAIGVFHAGVEYGLWEGVTACTADAGPGMTLDSMFKAAVVTPIVRCDVPQWTLFGISMAGYNAIISTIGAMLITALCLKRQKP